MNSGCDHNLVARHDFTNKLKNFFANHLDSTVENIKKDTQRGAHWEQSVVLFVLVAGAPRFFMRTFQRSELRNVTARQPCMISILYEESHFLVVNKPAGILTQAVPGIDSLHVQLVEQLRVRDQHAGRPFVGLPHRLDRGTSGALLIARNQRALKRFGAQFQHRTVQKFYVAWVNGSLQENSANWRDFLRKIENQAQAEIVTADAPGARLAELQIRSICCQGNQSLVLIQLFTGRMHQIRIQLGSRGFPIVGDSLYGSAEQFSGENHALHALRLEFRHPTTAVQLAVTAPFPESWNQAPDDIRKAGERLCWMSQQADHTAWNLESLDF